MLLLVYFLVLISLLQHVMAQTVSGTGSLRLAGMFLVRGGTRAGREREQGERAGERERAGRESRGESSGRESREREQGEREQGEREHGERE